MYIVLCRFIKKKQPKINKNDDIRDIKRHHQVEDDDDDEQNFYY